MPLMQFWRSDPTVVMEMSLEQVVANAGDGQLLDSSDASAEFREFLTNQDADILANYAEYCIEKAFNKSGQVLQDVVNELGRRLDYEVENGLYSGRKGSIGFDGLWREPNGHAVVVEVKTTDAYRINLDTLATYREALLRADSITDDSSILIIVGRQDTGDLEAQIRGSRHAWDVRVISVDSLIQLVRLKQAADEDETIDKIRKLLVPFEYTRVDQIIDIMFAAASDVEASLEIDDEDVDDDAEQSATSRFEFTPQEIINELRYKILAKLAHKEEKPLIKRTRAMFWSPDKSLRAVCTISKQHKNGGHWYAYHPAWDEFISGGEVGYFVLGCVGRDTAYALPYAYIHEQLEWLHTTQKADGSIYWHIHLDPTADGEMTLWLPKKQSQKVNISEYSIELAG